MSKCPHCGCQVESPFNSAIVIHDVMACFGRVYTQPEKPKSVNEPVTIYTDGGCHPNPGPGGYGAILISGDRRREIMQGFTRTTNNRMELRAVIAALLLLKRPCVVRVVSDSQYVVKAVQKRWIKNWKHNGWKRREGGKHVELLNADLWRELNDLLFFHAITFEWVKGHAGHPENERCDELATLARKGTLIADDGMPDETK